MSRFSRPRFVTPKLPTPPRALAQISSAVAKVTGLVALVGRVQSFSLGSFLQNTALAQLKTRLAAEKQNQLKAKLLARVPKPVIPTGVQAKITEVRAYQQEANNLFTSASSGLDEFGKAIESNRSRLR